MSHFSLLVLVPEKTKDIEKYVEKAMAPYSERIKVPEYEANCHCIGRQARDEVREAASKKFGDMDAIRTRFHKENAVLSKKVNDLLRASCAVSRDKAKRDQIAKEHNEAEEKLEKLWKVVIKPMATFEKEAFAKHRGRKKADPTCGFYSQDLIDSYRRDHPNDKKYQKLQVGDRYEDGSGCGGTGKYLTKYNPKSKWDWHEIGGRWTGAFLPGYDPAADPDNLETCFLCDGTGLRNDPLGIDQRKKDPEYTCNGCQGEGKSLKGRLKKVPEDIMATKLIPKDFQPFAIITPDGEWHEHGKMGWFATVSNEDEGWDQKAKSIINDFRKTTISVIVDCHI